MTLSFRHATERYSQRKATGPQDLLTLSLISEPQGPESARTGDEFSQYPTLPTTRTMLTTTSAIMAHPFDFCERASPLEGGEGGGGGGGTNAHVMPDYFNLTRPDDGFLSEFETLYPPDSLQQMLATTIIDPVTTQALTPSLHNGPPMLTPERRNNSSSSRTVSYLDTAVVSPDLNLDGGSSWVSPLHQAVQRGHHRIVQILLAHQANCNEQDGKGRTPLIYAVAGGYDEVVDLLLSHGAQIGIVDDEHRSVLHWAVINRRARLLKRLLRDCAGESAVIDGLTNEGKTPLLLAIETGVEAAVEVLLDAGADVHCRGPGQGIMQ